MESATVSLIMQILLLTLDVQKPKSFQSPLIPWPGALPMDPRYIGSLTHSLLRIISCGAWRLSCWPVVGGSPWNKWIAASCSDKSGVLHDLSLIHEVRGRPAGRFQPWCGMAPDLTFTASFSSLCADALSDWRRMWPKMEWRRAAMVLSMLGRFVLSSAVCWWGSRSI